MKFRISNFKSIKDLEINLSKVNLLIGPPSSGKSNILEALALYGYTYKVVETFKYRLYEDFPDNLFREIIRFKELDDVFYDPYKEIRINDIEFSIKNDEKSGKNLICKIDDLEFDIYHFYQPNEDHLGYVLNKIENIVTPTRLYKYREIPKNFNEYPDYYLSEDFSNIRKFSRYLKKDKMIKNILEKLGIDIDLNNLVIYDKKLKKFYSLNTLSDGIKRIIINYLAIYSNSKFSEKFEKDVIILLEEPETHIFPHYITDLAKMILYNDKIQSYVITTHNPYLIKDFINIAENLQKIDDIKVFIVYLDDEGLTKIKEYSGEEIFDKIYYEGVDILINYDLLI